ncbi:MAG: molybdenum cofactor guanylyltransferase [Alphaproteobacteria bacterium]|nr:molybdenum cofactor guanylyltransferase [Alphaproteobacteria bacterium]
MIGIVLAGGASSRFGGKPKGLVELAGRPMALRVADVLAQVCTRVLIEAPPNAGYEALGLPLLHAAPEHAGKGPLAGLATGLQSADDNGAFAPCDMPLLTPEIYRRLTAKGTIGAYAQTANGFEPLVAVLNAKILAALTMALRRPELPRTHAILDAAGASRLLFTDVAAFANVNTPGDLERFASAVSPAADTQQTLHARPPSL